MDQVYSRFSYALGLMLTLTACGDPAQFNELTIGEAIPVSENPEMSPLPDITPDTKSSTGTYSGEENPPVFKAPAPEMDAEAGDDPVQAGGSIATTTRLFTDCDDSPEKGIVAGLYELPVNTSRLPNFETLSALRTVCLSQLNIKDRNFAEGFPGVDTLFEWFALDMKFQVNVPKNGAYEFSLLADDGAILWIDDAKIIDNDGLHAVRERKAQIYLEAGAHTFHVAYYQGPRWRIALELFWKIPGSSSRTHIPASAISRLE